MDRYFNMEDAFCKECTVAKERKVTSSILFNFFAEKRESEDKEVIRKNNVEDRVKKLREVVEARRKRFEERKKVSLPTIIEETVDVS